MASSIFELVVNGLILFSLYPVYVTFNLLYLCFLCYSQAVQDDILGYCSFCFTFSIYTVNVEKTHSRIDQCYHHSSHVDIQ